MKHLIEDVIGLFCIVLIFICFLYFSFPGMSCPDQHLLLDSRIQEEC